jgi:hypothetical protein
LRLRDFFEAGATSFSTGSSSLKIWLDNSSIALFSLMFAEAVT